MSQPQSNKQSEERHFETFSEYWHFARCLSQTQRDAIYDSLSNSERLHIEKSFKRGGWMDLMMRNKLDVFIDDVKHKWGYDLLEIRSKVLSGKSVYLPTILWDYVLEKVYDIDYGEEHSQFILGGIRSVICDSNDQVVLLLPANSKESE